MRILHLADLHLGKRVNEFNLLEDQEYILGQILAIANEKNPHVILITGDVYDKTQPSGEAVKLLDEFLTQLTARDRSILIISGNHDSPERLSFGHRLLRKNRLYIAGVFTGTLEKVVLEDQQGKVNFYLLPFLKPALVRPFFAQEIEDYDESVKAVLSTAELNPQERNILLAHQFVVAGSRRPEISESEIPSVGGLDSVDYSHFAGFDYVALGHLHRPQSMGRNTVRYAGSPLKYSFSEARHEKSVTLVDLGEKGSIALEIIPLVPLRDMREIKGPLKELLCLGRNDKEGAQDYIKAILTDEEEIYDALGQLRQVYPSLMALGFENSRLEVAAASQNIAGNGEKGMSPLDLFAAFYQLQNNLEMTEEQVAVLEDIFSQAGGGKE